jgi:hypothetical protein
LWPVRLTRYWRRYQPGAFLALFAIPTATLVFLDLFVPGVGSALDDKARQHEVGGALLEHMLVAALGGTAAYYWLLGHKRQKALKKYRSRAWNHPRELVDWARHERPVVRKEMVESVSERIRRSARPEVVLVYGRAGTGRTDFIVGLVKQLARRSFLPIPVRAMIPIPVRAKRDGSFELEALAREFFCTYVGQVLGSDQQADAIWHRAKATHDIVILVDGLDDEVVATLKHDGGYRFRQAVSSLHSQGIAVVLATTGDLPSLDGITPLREDLDLFNRDEAEAYLREALGPDADGPAIAALARHRDPVEGFLIAPYYLDLLVRLEKNGIDITDPPKETDRWREEVIRRYLDGIARGSITPERPADADAPGPHTRARDAMTAAEAVARELTTKRADLTVDRSSLKEIGDRALADADELGLLWYGDERVGFVGEYVGAYLVAQGKDDPEALLADLSKLEENESQFGRRDRHIAGTLVFWHLQHGDPERRQIFQQLLSTIKKHRWTHPAVIAVAIRIASSCELGEFSEEVAAVTRRCIDSLGATTASGRRWDPGELSRLVRALAEWRDEQAHLLLWEIATHRDIEVDWAAAKALANSADGAAETLREVIDETLAVAENGTTFADMSIPDNDVGIKVSRMAWFLPALRGNEFAEKQLRRVVSLCREREMSPLRGELSLAQGLKLAILREKMVDENAADVHELLFKPIGGVRFWHARLVLVHALLVDAWRKGDEQNRVKLEALRLHEHHPLVRHAIDLALEGLRESKKIGGGTAWSKYMWAHERDAVRWVEQGKEKVAPLTADVVLLSNMTYRLRRQELHAANQIAGTPDLPDCIRRSSERRKIEGGCNCEHRLCQNPTQLATRTGRARFSENFCREQARLVARQGAPRWMKRGILRSLNTYQLATFWEDEADRIARK